MRVVWICTFSNPAKRSHLSMWRKSLGEWGQWIPNFVEGFKRHADIELHVVSVEPWMRRNYQSWQENGVTYHCVPETFPILHRAWPCFLPVDVWTHYALNSARIERIVHALKPDLVHLFGAENPHYSGSVLRLKDKYPVVVGIQGFGFREPFQPATLRKTLRLVIENRILQECGYFFGEYESAEVVKIFNRGATVYPIYFPVNEALASEINKRDVQKEYDLLFIGRLVPQKGVMDFIRIADRVRRKRPALRAAVVGRPDEYAPAQKLIQELKLERAIDFIPRFPTQNGLFDLYRKSRLFLVPTYNDCYPSTIRESAFLETPVLAYTTGGIRYSNQNGKDNVVLIPTGQWEQMAEKALALLGDPASQKRLAENLRGLAAEEFSLDVNVRRICAAYEEVLGDRTVIS